MERLGKAETDRNAARERAAEAEEALNALRASLARAQAALVSPGTADQRADAQQAVAAAREDLGQVRATLDGRPADAGTDAVEAALTAVDAALEHTHEALAASGAGLVSASTHTSLDRAQGALDAAQAALVTALEADPSDALRAVLSQAQGALTTAQVSLVPLLRQELAAAEGALADRTAERDTARGDAGTQRERADAAEGERDTARSEADRQRARADTAEDERDTARSEADQQRDRADSYDPRVPMTAALLPRERRFVPRVPGSIARTPRTDTGEEGWTKLDIATDAVAFTTGKRVGAAGGGLSATDELPLRSVTLRAAGRHRIKIQGDDGSPTEYSNTDGVLESALRIGDDGVTLKFGGEGLVYYDMQRTFDYHDNADGTAPNHDGWWRYGPDGKLGDSGAAAGGTISASHARDLGLAAAGGTLTADQATALQGYATDNSGACWRAALADCGDWAHDDLTIAFGAPAQSPEGEPAYYWRVQSPLTPQQRGTTLPKTMDPGDSDYDGRPQEVGTYELWLSHHGGVDDKGTEDTGDDTHRYLEYAAYGLFQVFDNVKAGPSFVRPQAFAFGYDAFRDEDNMRTTDIATSIEATFNGRTMAQALVNGGDLNFITLTGATPLRGDIALNACIGGTGCSGTGIPTGANKISGLISDLQEQRHDGVWIPHERGTSTHIQMLEGDIDADGSFGGALEHPQQGAGGSLNTYPWDGGATSTSKYGGNLYGPRNALEAAGWWHMQSDNRVRDRISSIIGSFGAKCTAGCDSN